MVPRGFFQRQPYALLTRESLTNQSTVRTQKTWRLYAGLMPYFDRGNVAQECKVGNTGALPAQARSKRVSSLKGNQWRKLTVPGIVSKSRLLSDPNTPWRAFGFFLLLLYPQSPVLAQRGTEAVELKGGAVGADNLFQF